MSADANPGPSGVPAMPTAALDGLRELYAELSRELAALAPRCELSGRCCDFKKSGMTLFATDLELAALDASTPLRAGGDPELCPWWEGGLCTAREGRPLGCRVYFCDATKSAALDLLSQRYHDRLKRLHEATGATYHYSPFVRRVRELASP
ncbi:MAG: hypothetical protein EXS13_12955 [Planctomycetes bacterium]|nr:hypothetical protein [Planctomycetota bacterium]